MASEIECYRKRSNYPILGPTTSNDLIHAKDIDRAVIPIGHGNGDWVMVADDEDDPSYIPGYHSKENSEPTLNVIVHVASLLCTLPMICLLARSFSPIL